MVLLHEMRKKPATVVTGKDLNEYFNVKVMSLTEACEEVTVVFDTQKCIPQDQNKRKRKNGERSRTI